MKVRLRNSCCVTFLLLVPWSYICAAALPRIRILATGGTIAGVQPEPGNTSYQSGALSVDQLTRTLPQIRNVAEISSEQVCNIGSQSMTNAIWLKLSKRLSDALSDPTVDGVVITHGTDTMEETGYFLSLVTKSDKPVVMVGAMRPQTSLSADGPMNLYDAIAVAADPQAKGFGVLVVINNEIHFAREVEKINTIQVNGFESPNRGRAGTVVNGHVHLFSKLNVKYGVASDFTLDNQLELPEVEIVYSYANLRRGVIDYLVSQGVRGIVLAGVGDGNTTDDALAGLSDAAKKRVVIVRSTRVESGVTRRDVEVNDDQLGFIASEELNPQKARVLLMLGLTRTRDTRILQQYFLEY